MNEIESLNELRKVAWKHLKSSHDLLVRAKKLANCLEHRYERDKKEYEDIDHQLALIDGRAQRVAAAAAAASAQNSKRKPKPQTDLTEDQILMVARQLGLILPEVEEVEDE